MNNDIKWDHISQYQKLREQFISESGFWDHISRYQKLSEQFIREFKDKVNWFYISIYQKLSEQFIEEFKDKFEWYYVSSYQKLSERLIIEFKDKVNWNYVSYTMKITDPILQQYIKKENNWIYLDDIEKETIVQKYYQITNIDGKRYVYCFKAVRLDYGGLCDTQFVYDKLNEIYETICDYNYSKEDSFGFVCWTHDTMIKYGKLSSQEYRIIKVMVPFDNICVIKSNGKIRSSQMTVVEL